MKLNAKLALFLFLFAFTAKGQIILGLRGGYGLSSTSQEIVKGMKRSIGSSPMMGAIIHYNMDIRFSVGMEVNYYKLSETLNYEASFSPIITNQQEVVTKTEISYLQIPVTGRVSIGEKKYRGFLCLGPYIGIGTSGSWNTAPEATFAEINGNKIPKNVIFDPDKGGYGFDSKKMRRLDIGGIFGGGIEYKLGPTGLIFAEARVQLGFFDIYSLSSFEERAFKSNSAYQLPSASWRAVNFSVGYLRTFKLPKLSLNQGVKKAGKQKS
jgi:hypothetical protein